MTFSVIFCSIRKFAKEVTEPINDLKDFTDDYRIKQTMEEKKKVVKLMEKSEIFKDTKKQIRWEEYIAECYKLRPQE